MYCNFSLLFCLCIICFADADRQLHERAMSKDHGCFGGLGDVSWWRPSDWYVYIYFKTIYFHKALCVWWDFGFLSQTLILWGILLVLQIWVAKCIYARWGKGKYDFYLLISFTSKLCLGFFLNPIYFLKRLS